MAHLEERNFRERSSKAGGATAMRKCTADLEEASRFIGDIDAALFSHFAVNSSRFTSTSAPRFSSLVELSRREPAGATRLEGVELCVLNRSSERSVGALRGVGCHRRRAKGSGWPDLGERRREAIDKPFSRRDLTPAYSHPHFNGTLSNQR